MMLHRLVCYIYHTLSHRLTARIYDDIESWSLMQYVDADLASEPDDSRSSNGHALVLSGKHTKSTVNYGYKRQTSTAMGTPEAEVVSMAHGVKTSGLPAVSFWETVLERNVQLTIGEDNETAITIAENGYMPIMRHLGRTQKTSVGFLGDCVADQLFQIEKVPTEEQVADIFTKSIKPHAWAHALELIGISIING